ncbi:HAMP domain-containing protein [Cohnella sp. CFH 77786]|uniref:sensor histidine kinase n=1 Tax=Cohnella sp. CFH 77786 TaxID=2662265 RepID=UPI001C60CF8A|nr:sensor histidine kinase [Cohnella sp. CFH 77786]MBW5445264.1 HAMP domain-containing protein [Cohnella sp. CFH 77786]
MSIMRKMILGYAVLIFIPVIAFGYHYYTQTYGNLTQQFVESRQKILEQAYANMKTELARIQSVHRMLQYNPYLTDYLDGVYQSDADSVYAFIRYISPLFSQSLFASPEIESVVIYKMKDRVLPISDHILDLSKLDSRRVEAVRSIKPGRGVWVRADPEVSDPDLIYYQYLYNTQITEKIGLLEIRVRSSLIRHFYEAAGVEENWEAFLLSEQGKPLFGGKTAAHLDDGTLRMLQSKNNTFFINRKTIVNQQNLEELGVRVIVTGQVGDVFHAIKRREIVMVTTIVLLLAGLSFAYYALVSTISKRILRLARHMRTLRDDNLKPLVIKQDKLDGRDEIGFLTQTYNSMIRRMDELINNVHRAELRHKEAAYKVLQAQIKPHFLYNTLETIRMLAESHDDKEVADISFWFGKLMRYSLSPQKDETVLAKEIEMVTFFLNIHKMRLQSRLTYEIDVALDAGNVRCPRFLLQPLLENCIAHGASTVLRTVHIRLSATETAEEIRVTVSDNGSGIPPEKLQAIQARLARRDEAGEEEQEGGVGLVNVNERIRSFYGGASRLEIASNPGQGTALCVIIAKGGEPGDENIDRGR